jgi:hypothetical protein
VSDRSSVDVFLALGTPRVLPNMQHVSQCIGSAIRRTLPPPVNHDFIIVENVTTCLLVGFSIFAYFLVREWNNFDPILCLAD